MKLTWYTEHEIQFDLEKALCDYKSLLKQQNVDEMDENDYYDLVCTVIKQNINFFNPKDKDEIPENIWIEMEKLLKEGLIYGYQTIMKLNI